MWSRNGYVFLLTASHRECHCVLTVNHGRCRVTQVAPPKEEQETMTKATHDELHRLRAEVLAGRMTVVAAEALARRLVRL